LENPIVNWMKDTDTKEIEIAGSINKNKIIKKRTKETKNDRNKKKEKKL
jgi:hypothetical protein